MDRRPAWLVTACGSALLAAVTACGGRPAGARPSVDLEGECLLLYDNGSAVLGMDGAYSVPLEGGRSLFVFGDTFFGRWSGSGRVVEGAVASSAAIVDDADVATCFAGATFVGGPRPTRFLEPPAGSTPAHRTWPGPGIVTPDGLVFGFSHVREDVEGLGFVTEHVGLARGGLTPPSASAAGVPLLPPEPGWNAFLVEGDAVYAYRCAPGPFFGSGWYPCILGRAPVVEASDPSAYAYWVAGAGFTGSVAEASVVTEGAPELTVTWNPHLAAYLLVTVEPFAREVSVRTAAAPEGPFSERRAIWPCHLPAEDPGGYCHGAKWHPQLGDGDGRQIVVTYNRNTTDPAAFRRDPAAYFPHLVVIDLDAR